MSLFVFSIFAGLLLYQIVALIQPRDSSRMLRLGRRVIVQVPERDYVIWKAGALAVTIVLFFLVVTVLVAQGVHPSEGYAYRFADALTSPRMAAGVFGGLVGLLVGNLLNRL